MRSQVAIIYGNLYNGNWQYFLSQFGYLDFFTEIFIELSSKFHINFVGNFL